MTKNPGSCRNLFIKGGPEPRKKDAITFFTGKKSGSNFLVFYASYQQNSKTYRQDESEGGSAGRWPGVGGAPFYEADLRSPRDLAHPLRNDPA